MQQLIEVIVGGRDTPNAVPFKVKDCDNAAVVPEKTSAGVSVALSPPKTLGVKDTLSWMTCPGAIARGVVSEPVKSAAFVPPKFNGLIVSGIPVGLRNHTL